MLGYVGEPSLILTAAVLLVCILAIAIFLGWKRKSPPYPAPKGVVVLYQIGRGPFCPSVSPFPLKLETFLRFNKIPYMNIHSSRFSKKGKTPWIEYNGQAIADSQFCIDFLSRELGIDMNSHLTPVDKSISRAFQKMSEENTYWSMCYEMFAVPDKTRIAEVMPQYKGFKLWAFTTVFSRVIKKELYYQGIGRHSDEEIWTIGRADLQAISTFLGDKKFFMGDRPSQIDCAMFGMLAQVLWHMPRTRHEKFAHDRLPNIDGYCERMKELCWPDWDKLCLKHPSYQDDNYKTYHTE
ncbi:failed axon connections homolog [Haliotis rufescens]|uniref:failed axon connections homolog n=1 Tax=Haliotis rufescens TaxID=6454 RepID=UPI001EB09558|nr:failed axon connections homolog [Haliotis rufescens]